MPSIPVNSLELNSLAVTTTAAGLCSFVPALNLLTRAQFEFRLPCLGRAFKVDLPYPVQRMKLHWTPPEANSSGTCASYFILVKILVWCQVLGTIDTEFQGVK